MSAITPKYPLSIPGLPQERILRKDGLKSEWVHVVCSWKEIKKVKNQTKIIPHNYEAVANCITKKFYINDEKWTFKPFADDPIVPIGVKLSFLAVATPVVMLAKTIYHIFFPVSLAYQIYNTVKEAKEQEAAKNGKKITTRDLATRIIKVIGKNFLDIVKTPLYAIAMAIVALGSVILSIFKSDMLYHGRAAFGELLMSLNWGKKKTIWTIAPCMQPIADLNKDERKKYYVQKDTEYEGPPGTMIHGLNNLARSHP